MTDRNARTGPARRRKGIIGAMNDDLLKKLEQKMDRRSFLRGSALTAAAFAALPLAARAQDQQPGGNKEQDKEKEKDKDQKQEQKVDEKAEKQEKKKDGDAEKDPFKETKLDAQGREYRMCPQCGYNMYKQDRTWTCENCGYSYVE